jgi:hypothetical protein
MTELKLTPSRVALSLLAVVAFLLACYAAVAFHRLESTGPDARFAMLFDLDLEGNIPSWYNSSLFIIGSAVSWICGQFARQLDRKQTYHWFAISAVMLVLSIDELLALHELLGNIPMLKGGFVFGWIMVVGPIAALFGLWFVPFLFRLPASIALCLAAAGLIYLGGAIGLESVGGKIAEAITQTPSDQITPELSQLVTHNRWYLTEVALEETCEMSGLILYIYGALRYLARARATLHASFRIS